MKRLIPCFLIAGITFFSACENEQMTDMEKQGTELPEGKYPLTFTAVQAAPEGTPQTRVSESEDGMSSHWENGDKIHVLINGGGFENEELVCTLNEKGEVTDYDKTLYWKNSSPATYTAWYDNAGTDGKVTLSDQSQSLAYVLKATANDVSYNSKEIKLKFHHQLAKVRVIVEGSKKENVKEVKILSYPKCTSKQEKVEGNETKEYITMHHQDGTKIWEANVVAEQLINDDLNKYVKLIRNDSEEDLIVSITLNNSNTLQAGKINEIRINAKGKPVTITDNGTYEITGNSEPIIIGKEDGSAISPTIIFNDATITADDTHVIEIISGNPTLIFKGENVLRHDSPEYTPKYVIYSPNHISKEMGLNIQLVDNAKLAIIAKETSPIYFGKGMLSISGNGELYLDGKRNYCPAIQCENNTKLDIQGVTLTAVSRKTNVSLGAKTPNLNQGSNHNVAIDLQNCTLKLYANNDNGYFWVYPGGKGAITSNGSSIKVNEELEKINFDKEVELGSGVKAIKLQNAPDDIPDWAKK